MNFIDSVARGGWIGGKKVEGWRWEVVKQT